MDKIRMTRGENARNKTPRCELSTNWDRSSLPAIALADEDKASFAAKFSILTQSIV